MNESAAMVISLGDRPSKANDAESEKQDHAQVLHVKFDAPIQRQSPSPMMNSVYSSGNKSRTINQPYQSQPVVMVPQAHPFSESVPLFVQDYVDSTEDLPESTPFQSKSKKAKGPAKIRDLRYYANDKKRKACGGPRIGGLAGKLEQLCLMTGGFGVVMYKAWDSAPYVCAVSRPPFPLTPQAGEGFDSQTPEEMIEVFLNQSRRTNTPLSNYSSINVWPAQKPVNSTPRNASASSKANSSQAQKQAASPSLQHQRRQPSEQQTKQKSHPLSAQPTSPSKRIHLSPTSFVEPREASLPAKSFLGVSEELVFDSDFQFDLGGLMSSKKVPFSERRLVSFGSSVYSHLPRHLSASFGT